MQLFVYPFKAELNILFLELNCYNTIMNLENYNEEILYLSNQAKEYLDNYDRKIFTTLRKLEKAASVFDDHALDGYIYFLMKYIQMLKWKS